MKERRGDRRADTQGRTARTCHTPRPRPATTRQLRLLPERRVAWPLDPATRERGLRGVARAREALDAAQGPGEPLREAS